MQGAAESRPLFLTWQRPCVSYTSVRRPRSTLLPVTLILLAAVAQETSGADPVWDSILPLTTNTYYQYTGYARQHSIAVDGQGNVHVTWVDQRTVPYQLWYRRFDRAQQVWLPETMLTNQPVDCNQPGIACDQSGRVSVVWHTGQYPCYGIWYKRYDGLRWYPDTLIDSGRSERFGFYPSVSYQLGGERLHVVWYGIPNGSMHYQVFHKEWRPGSGWSAAEVITDALCPHDQVSVAADKNDNLCVTWCGLDLGGGINQVFCRRRVNGFWLGVELVSELSNSLTQYAPFPCADDSGGFHVVWHGRSGNDIYQNIYHRLRTPAGWSSITVLTVQTMRQQGYPSISCLANGEGHAVWCGQTATSQTSQLYHAWRSQGGVWSQPTRLTDRSANVCHPAITGQDSMLHVVWYDVSSGNQDVYYLRGRLESTGLEQAGEAPVGDWQFAVFPNPIISGLATLRLSSQEAKRSSGLVRIYDAAGRCVFVRPLVIGECAFSMPLDMRGLSSGVYLVEVKHPGLVARTKVVCP